MRNRYMHPCIIPGCINLTDMKEYCRAHSDRVKKYGHPMVDVPLKPQTPKGGKQPCAVDGCERLNAVHGYCNAHYLRTLRYGEPLPDAPIRKGKTKRLEVADGFAWCTRCYRTLVLDRFATNSAKRSGVASWCKDCHWEYRLLRSYGITYEQYADMWAAQNGKCAACKEPEYRTHPDGRVRMMCVDHDHRCCPGSTSCGRCVRGLLCGDCNTGLGMFDDSPTTLRLAADYLDRWEADGPSRVQTQNLSRAG